MASGCPYLASEAVREKESRRSARPPWGQPGGRKILVREYLATYQAHKIAMEKRYGKKWLRAMPEVCELESPKSCSCCSAPIQKSGGCNKMTCDRCGTPGVRHPQGRRAQSARETRKLPSGSSTRRG